MLTINPGWDRAGQNLDSYTDVREIQKTLKAAGLELASEADDATSEPASLMLFDPDAIPF